MGEIWKKFKLRGGAIALARLVAILFGLVIFLVGLGKENTTVVAIGAAFLGAAVSLFLDWVVSVLEKPGPDSIEMLPCYPDLVSSAKTDLSSVGYYREDQHLRVAVTFDEKFGQDIIELIFTARIVPVSERASVDHPEVAPPEGVTEVLTDSYWIGSTEVGIGSSAPVSNKSTDKLTVRYLIDSGISRIEDTHIWPSPVINYSVTFVMSNRFIFNVVKRIGSTKLEELDQENQGSDEQRFFGRGAALRGQSLKWTLQRK